MNPKLFFVALLSLLIGLPTAKAQLLFTNFGVDVDVYGHEVLIGEPNSRYRPGIVYVFTRGDEGAWTEHKQIKASDASNHDGFGESMAVSGDRLLVGASRQNGGLGAAYVFEHRHGEGWIETARLTSTEIDEADAFGSSVAVEGDLAAVGAPGRVVNGPPGHPRRAGAVLVFRRKADEWQLVARLTGSAAAPASAFGHTVAIAGGRIAVGAPGHNQHEGAAYVFAEKDGEWIEAGMLTATDADPGSEFGAVVEARGDEIYVGAPGFEHVGAVFAYEYDPASTSWSQTRAFHPFDGPRTAAFGSSIDAGPDGTLWIGAPVARGLQGVVYELRRDAETGDWLSASILSAENPAFMDIFAGSVAVSDGIGVAGLIGDDGMAGTVEIFERGAANTWRSAGLVRSAPVSLPKLTGDRRDCTNGEAGVFECRKVDLLAFLPVEDVGGNRGVWVNDLWGWTDPQSGKEYVLLGRTNGTSFIDISDPSNPVFVGQLPMTEGAQAAVWRDIKVHEDHAFIVADNAGRHGVQVFDLTTLRDVSEQPATFEETAHYDGIHSAHNIVINTNTGFAYTVGSSGGGETCGGGLHMIDVRDPSNPTFAGCYSHSGTGMQGTGYTHDAQCVIYNGPDDEYRGREICFSANETALSIGDVTKKDSVTYISTGTYPNSAYVHQGWLTDDHRYFYINDEGDEVNGLVDETRTLIWDVTDLDDPQLANEYTWGERSSDHNLYVRGNLMYQSNYVGGLRVHDISDPVNPKEVAYFDTVPAGDNGPGFAGSWSNYPYFKSEVIAVSSMKEGLFLLKKQKEVGL